LSSPFQVHFLGSGAALPTNLRAPIAQYIVCNNRHLLIDCGEGTQIQMRKYGVHFQKITTIFISHLHGDHYFGLVGLLSTMNLLGRTSGLTVYGPPLLEEILRLQFEAGNSNFTFKMQFIPLEMKEKTLILEDRLMKVFAFPLKHRVKTFGFIIEEKKDELRINKSAVVRDEISVEYLKILKKGLDVELINGDILSYLEYTLPSKSILSYAYCSDTAPFAKLPEYIKGCTALYHEATFAEEHKERAKSTQHSTAKQAAQIAFDAGIQQLYLGHFSSRYTSLDTHLSEASEVFPSVCLIEDGMQIIIKA